MRVAVLGLGIIGGIWADNLRQDGLAVHSWNRTAKDVPGFAATFLVGGTPPRHGAVLRQAKLAMPLDHLARAGLGDFYRGDVGREIASDLEQIGSPVTRGDLERYEAKIREPLSVTLRAFRVRDRYVTDFAELAHPPARYLEAAFLDAEAFAIDPKRAAPWPAPPVKGDTIWMGAADAKGVVVSYIQSLYWEFGSGCVLPATGVLMQNRGASFSLDPAAVNPLTPGRRPFHTLNPALAVLADKRVIAYGTMGGDGQPQTQGQLFSRHVMFGQPLDRAIDAPRFLLGRTWGSAHTNLRLEARFDDEVVDRLASAGHDVEVLGEGYSDTMGHAGAVVLHPDGTLEGAHDPRADGGAAGV